MIINIFWLLLLLGSVAVILPKEKHTKSISFVFFVAFGVLLYVFIDHMLKAQSSIFVYAWLKYQKLHIDINLSSNVASYQTLLPFVLITGCSLFINIFSHEEKMRIGFISAAVINLAALFFLQGSDNLIQLLIGSYIVSFLGIYIIGNLEAREKFVYYNLLADMMLFAAFSIIYGLSGNVSLKDLPKLANLPSQKDLIVLLLLFSVFIKSGLFLFYNQFFDVASVGFNRLLLFLSCSSPAAAIIILQKTQTLLNISDYAQPILYAFAGATIIYAVITGLVLDNIKFRAICFYLLMYGFVYAGAFRLPRLDELLLCGALIGLCLYVIYCASGNELYLSQMGGFIKKMKFSFLLTLGIVPVLLQTVLAFENSGKWVWLAGALPILLLSHLFYQVYLGRTQADKATWTSLKNADFFLILPLFIGLVGFIVFYPHPSVEKIAWGMAAFVFLILIAPLRRLSVLANNETLQEDDYLESFYDFVLMTPLRIAGRLLWLLIDFLIIERTIMNSINRGMDFLVKTSQKLHTSTVLSYILMTLLGAAVIIISWYKG